MSIYNIYICIHTFTNRYIVYTYMQQTGDKINKEWNE